MKKSISISKQVLFISSGKLITVLASFILPLFLTRYLTKSDYGIYNQFSMVVSFCTMFFSFGMASNIYYFATRINKNQYSSLILNTHLLLFFGSLISFIFITFPSFLSSILGETNIFKYKTYLYLTVLVAIPITILQPLFITRKDLNASLFFPPSEPILKVILLISASILFDGLEPLIITVFILYLFQYIFTIIYSGKLVLTSKKNTHFSLSLLKEQVKYSLPLGLASSIKVLMQSFDKLIIIGFVSASQYATYAVAFFGIPGIVQVYGSFSQVYVVEMTKEFENYNTEKVILLYRELISKTISFTIPIVFVVCLYSEKIITFLFTDKYLDSVPYFQIYIFTLVFQVLGNGLIIRASGKTKASLYSYLFTAIIILPSTFFLVKYYSLYGAMFSAVLSITIPKILMTYFDLKIINSSLIRLFPIKDMFIIIIIGLVALLPFHLLKASFDYEITSTIFLGVIYIFINAILQYFSGVFIFQEKIKKYFQNIKNNDLN